MTIQPDRGYLKTRAELINYELAAFAALRAGVPDCYRDGGDNTAWGWILHTMARKVGELDYQDLYNLISHDPELLTPPDLLRQVVYHLPLGQSYPNNVQYDLEFQKMVLRLLKAYRYGARLDAMSAVIEAFTGADPSTFSVTEMYTKIGTPGVDVSYRNTIRIEVPLGGNNEDSSLFTSTPNLIQDVYKALAATKAAHIGIELIGVFPGSEDASHLIMGIKDSFKIIMAMADGSPSYPWLTLTPYDETSSPNTVLAPGQVLDLTYQWFKNGAAVEGATDASLVVLATIPGVGLKAVDTYYVVVSDPVLGTVMSKQIPMVISAPTVAKLPAAMSAEDPVDPSTSSLTILQQPMSFSVYAGQVVTLTVVAGDAGQLGILVPHGNPQWVIKSDNWIAQLPNVGHTSGGMTMQGHEEGTAGFGEPVSVSIAPLDPNVMSGFYQQFTATVTGGASDHSVVWSLGGIIGGDSTRGSIDTTGKLIPTMGGVVTATSVADPTKSASTSAYATSGFFVTQDKCAALSCEAIYHLDASSGNIQVRKWNAPANTPNPDDGADASGWSWPTQPGQDSYWCSAPASSATVADCSISVDRNGVYLALWEGNATPGKFQLYFRAYTAVTNDLWTQVTLPSGMDTVYNVKAMISANFTSQGIVLVGVQDADGGTQNVVSWSSAPSTISWGTDPQVVYNGTGVSPVVSWADAAHAQCSLVDPVVGYCVLSSLPGSWSSPTTLYGSAAALPDGLDRTKPYGLVQASSGAPDPMSGWLLWGWSTVNSAATVWPMNYGNGSTMWSDTPSNGGSGTGFTDPGITSPTSMGGSVTTPTAINYAVAQDTGAVLLVMQSPCMDSRGNQEALWAVSVQGPGRWSPILTLGSNPLIANVGDTIGVTTGLQGDGCVNSNPTAWDWSASTMGDSWSFEDTGGGSGTLTKLSDGGGFTLTCNMTITCPSYGGMSWTASLTTTESGYTENQGQPSPAAQGDTNTDGSWGIYASNSSTGYRVPIIRKDLATGLLVTDWPVGATTQPCVSLPLNMSGLNPSAGYVSVVVDGSVLGCFPQS